MSWKIVVDSSADLPNNYEPSGDILLEEVPLSVRIANEEFQDTNDLDILDLVDRIEKEKSGSSTSCPSPGSFETAYNEADNIIVITMSKNLSGTYNSADVAKNEVLEKNPDKQIAIIDSLATCGAEYLLVEKAEELINQGLDFETVVDELQNYQKTLKTLFTLESFDNLIKNGRLNKFVGMIAKRLNVRIVGQDKNGTLDIVSKVRGEARALKNLVDVMGKRKSMDNAEVIIAHVDNNPGAITLKHLIEKKYPEVKSIRIIPAGGVNSFYAERGGLIIGY